MVDVTPSLRHPPTSRWPFFVWLAYSFEGLNRRLLCLCALMAAVGFAAMRGAYRSWLNRDLA